MLDNYPEYNQVDEIKEILFSNNKELVTESDYLYA